MEAHRPTSHTKNIELYRRLERTHKRWRTIRRLSDLSIEEVAFFIGLDESRARSSLERQARKYYATLLGYEKLERTNDLLRAHRMQQGLSVSEAAFLFAGIEDTDPLSNKLRAARLRTGLSQEDVAYIIGKPRHMLSRFERGERNPDLVTAMSFPILYDLTFEELFPQRSAFNRRLKKRERMLAAWRRTRRSPASSAP